jgi:CMP/dCMP kinase
MNIITIDGPAGSGKSTIAKILANKLGYTYINSGAIYRAFAFWLLSQKYLNLSNAENIEIEKILNEKINEIFNDIKNFNLEYIWKDNDLSLFLNSEDITDTIRLEKISNLTSIISKNSKIREFITDIQRQIADKNDVILEGRDSGTVVFPNANRKFFLVADIDERVKRRVLELKHRGEIVDENDLDEIEKIKNFIKNRDFQDENRTIAPLKKAIDAIEVDTTGKNISEVITILENFILN